MTRYEKICSIANSLYAFAKKKPGNRQMVANATTLVSGVIKKPYPGEEILMVIPRLVRFLGNGEEVKNLYQTIWDIQDENDFYLWREDVKNIFYQYASLNDGKAH